MKQSIPRRARFLHGVALCVLVALASACSYTGYRPAIQHIGTERHKPRPADYPIAVTERDFAQPYHPIAQVRSGDHDARLVEVAGFEELRAIARKIGGDAVVRVTRDAVVRDKVGYNPGYLFRRGQAMEERIVLSGVVVRFIRETPSALPPE
jgi:hypothetical protein